MDDQLTAEEIAEIQKFVGPGAPSPKEEHNVHTFLNSVLTREDTTRIGFLSQEEVGLPKYPIRTVKNLSLISDKVMDNPFLKDFFEAESQIVTATSLSKDAKLLNLAVIQRRQLEDVTKHRKPSKGWFKKKDKKEDEE